MKLSVRTLKRHFRLWSDPGMNISTPSSIVISRVSSFYAVGHIRDISREIHRIFKYFHKVLIDFRYQLSNITTQLAGTWYMLTFPVWHDKNINFRCVVIARAGTVARAELESSQGSWEPDGFVVRRILYLVVTRYRCEPRRVLSIVAPWLPSHLSNITTSTSKRSRHSTRLGIIRR